MPISKATASSIAPAAKGDLVVGSATNDAAVLTVGANDTVLTADSSTATGLKWAALNAWIPNFSLLNGSGTSMTGSGSITISGISGKNQLYVHFTGVSTSADQTIYWQVNSDTGNNYRNSGITISRVAGVYNAGGNDESASSQGNAAYSLAAATVSGGLTLFGTNTSGVKPYKGLWANNSAATNGEQYRLTQGVYLGSSVISSITFFVSSGTFDAGTVYVYGG